MEDLGKIWEDYPAIPCHILKLRSDPEVTVAGWQTESEDESMERLDQIGSSLAEMGLRISSDMGLWILYLHKRCQTDPKRPCPFSSALQLILPTKASRIRYSFYNK